MTLSKILEQIDMFYEDGDNQQIPVIEAYIYITKRIKGATRQELDSLEANLRKRAPVNHFLNDSERRR